MVPWPAGGSADLIGRVVADHLTGVLKQTVVVENRGGAAGMIGSLSVSRADPDGLTLLVSGIPSHVIAPATSPKPEYDGVKDFTHIAYLGGPPIVLAAHTALKVSSLKELIAAAKTSKEPIGYVSAGVGSLGHIHAEYLAQREKIKIQHIPYRGGAQAAQDFIAGHVRLGSMTWSSARAGIQGGQFIPLAVSSSRRQPDFPNIPTFKDLGYDELTTATWWSISGPPDLPADIVETAQSGNPRDAEAVLSAGAARHGIVRKRGHVAGGIHQVCAGRDQEVGSRRGGRRNGEEIEATRIAALRTIAEPRSWERALPIVLTGAAMDDIDERAQKMRLSVLGTGHAQRTAQNRTKFNDDFFKIIARLAWGEVWSRPGLDIKTRSMLTIAMLVAMGKTEELRLHIRATRNTGVTQEEVSEILIHAMVYAGVPAAFGAFQVAGEVYAEMEGEENKSS